MPGPRTLRQAQGMLHGNGSGERASHPGHGERRHPSGDRTPQAEEPRRKNHDGRTTTEEPRSEPACCRPFPGGPPLQKTDIPAFDGAERPGEVKRHNPGGRDPVGKNGSYSPNCRCPRVTTTGGGPVHRWRARALQGKQDSSTASTRIPWNKLSSPEEAAVLATARESSEWSSRQLATWITDHLRLSVGESTVYRLLRVKPPDM